MLNLFIVVWFKNGSYKVINVCLRLLDLWKKIKIEYMKTSILVDKTLQSGVLATMTC